MEINDSPLKNEIDWITSNGPTGTNYSWEAVIHYGEDQLLVPLKVISVNNKRDYAQSFTDEMTVTLLIPLGKYARKIYPNRTNLQITLTKIPLGELVDEENTEVSHSSERYTAILIDQGPAITEGQGTESNDEFVLDLTDLLDVHFQLLNKALEQVRLIEIGGVFRKVKTDDLLETVLTVESQKADVDEQRAIVGVDISPVSNKDIKEQIVVTHGIKLVDFPDYLQKKVGIYNAGLGSYVQNKFWHLFPLYDISRYDSSDYTLTLIILPKRKYTNIERTYLCEGTSATVLITGQTLMKDDSGSQYMNQGNGARLTSASSLIESSAVTKDNKTKYGRANNNSEFITDAIPSGNNHVPVPPQRISDNPFTVFSNLNARNGGMFRGIWQNSDPSILLPGMATRILYADNEDIKEVYGVLHTSNTISHHHGDIHNRRFQNQTVLEVFYRFDVNK